MDEENIGIINPFRYRSYYYDNETKLYYLNSRYYNPEWGRFISADTILGANQDFYSNNLYLYVSNNPINNVDETGTIIQGIITLGKTLIKGAGTIFKKSIGISASITKVANIDTSKIIKKAIYIDYSEDYGITKNIISSKSNKPIEIEFNIENLFEKTLSIQLNTNIGSIGYSTNGLGDIAIKYNNVNGDVIESGGNNYSYYILTGKEIETGNGTQFVYNKVTISKLYVALLVLTNEARNPINDIVKNIVQQIPFPTTI